MANIKRALKASSTESVTVFIHPLEERWPVKVKRCPGRSGWCLLSDLETGGDRQTDHQRQERDVMFKEEERGLVFPSVFGSRPYRRSILTFSQ